MIAATITSGQPVPVPVLVVQGERDPFGRPEPAPGREVVLLRGNHSLRSDLPGLRAAITSWLAELVSEKSGGNNVIHARRPASPR